MLSSVLLSLTEEDIKNCQSENIEINPYTVNEEKQMRRLIEFNITNIITDETELGLRLMEKRDERSPFFKGLKNHLHQDDLVSSNIIQQERSMAIKLIAIDIDGTLINSKNEITPYYKRGHPSCTEQGVRVVLCTGRPFFRCTKICERIGIRLARRIFDYL